MNEKELQGQLAELKRLQEKEAKQQERQRNTARRLRAKQNVLMRKAREAGIKVSEQEVQDELAKMG